MLGDECKGYQVWGRLSSGGMGDVWLARHRELALPVIIKTLRPMDGESSENRYARLLQEARLMARLSSPGVVRVIDVGQQIAAPSEAVPFLVEEYVDGIDLSEHASRRRSALQRPMPLWAVASLIGQAAAGLHTAHQAGVIHRDVKPSNVFVYGDSQVKVGDFGVAVPSAVGSESAPAGTPMYMAPEQFGGATIDRRVDVYGLGATAFALRYGQPPFGNMHEILDHEKLPRFPSPRSPQEAYFQHVLCRMMSFRTDGRYANLAVVRHYFRSLARATRPDLMPIRCGPGNYQLGQTNICFQVGSIADVAADALVNSASSEMAMTTGTGEALLKRGGAEIQDQALAAGEQALGECVLTGPGALSCAGVLHAVGGWNEVSCVARATHRAVLLAAEHGFQSIAFPAIGTGHGRVSLESCADSMMGALRMHVNLGGSKLKQVRIVLYDQSTHDRFLEVAEGLLFGGEESIPLDDSLEAALPDDTNGAAVTVFAKTVTK